MPNIENIGMMWWIIKKNIHYSCFVNIFVALVSLSALLFTNLLQHMLLIVSRVNSNTQINGGNIMGEGLKAGGVEEEGGGRAEI